MGLERPAYSYRHPSKDAGGEQVEHRDDTPSKERSRLAQTPNVEPSAEKLYMSAPAPAFGASSAAERRATDVTFAVPAHGGLILYADMIAFGIAPKTAILAVGTRALRAYEDAATDIDHLGLLERFGSVTFQCQTRRVIGTETFERARGTLDPFGVRSGKELGRLFGRTVIQHWIESGNKLVS